jgi:hypothetical protein
MGVNWDSGLIYWKDHVAGRSERFPLSHLHPFAREVALASSGALCARRVRLHVSFGLHTFTRATHCSDPRSSLYLDNREVRTFCRERYERSLELPRIFQTIEKRHCEFARSLSNNVNYVVVESSTGDRYAAFFDLRRLRKVGRDAVHLMVQSAYVLERDKPPPGKGRIHFNALVRHTLCGTTPHRPP